MRNKENIRTLVEKGNELFRYGRTSEAVPHFALVLMESGALKIVARYVIKYRDNKWIKLRMLDELLKNKYNINLVDGALELILDSTLSQIISLEGENDYRRFKKVFQGKNLKTKEDYADILLNYFGEDYLSRTMFFYKICYDMGFRLDACEILELLRERKKKIKLDRFERSLLGDIFVKTSNIDRMTGFEFEEFLVQFFKTCGYIVTKTKPGHDYGADLILERFGERTVVQAKRQKRSIGLKAVQEVTAAKKYYRAHKALVVINGTFTKNAKELAKSNYVELWNRTRLMQEIKKMHFV
ncbi:putative endonuclease [Thermoplasmatales archaeon SCGC AB-539-C06]|nr:putative endonuclease [Thermoplasmatales archaeon SCGC AB-539-C06]